MREKTRIEQFCWDYDKIVAYDLKMAEMVIDSRLQRLKLERERLDESFPEVLQVIDKGKLENLR